MAVLDYNEIKPKKVIVHQGIPFEIVENLVARTNQRKPQNQVKMRNLLNGKVIPETFHATESVEEADVRRENAKFLYSTKGEFWFCDPKDPKNRYTIATDLIGDNAKYLKTDTVVDVVIWTDSEDEEKMLGVKLPIKVTLEVKEAPPAIKGDTAAGGGKMVTLETGARVVVPLFIEAGEKLVINTETGEYVERA
jgi:elongation factor P